MFSAGNDSERFGNAAYFNIEIIAAVVVVVVVVAVVVVAGRKRERAKKKKLTEMFTGRLWHTSA